MKNPDFFVGQLPTAPRTAAVSDSIKHTDVCYHISEHFAHKTHTLDMQINKTDFLCQLPERYVPQPLVIQGPGAGAAVTAAGIYADFLRIVDQCPEGK